MPLGPDVIADVLGGVLGALIHTSSMCLSISRTIHNLHGMIKGVMSKYKVG